jgi:hypothetical protein
MLCQGDFAYGTIAAMPPKKGVDLPELLTMRLDQDMRKRLEAMAKEEERTLGQMARILLREAMAAREKGKKRK